MKLIYLLSSFFLSLKKQQKNKSLIVFFIILIIFSILSQLIWTNALTSIPNTGDEYSIWFQSVIFSKFQISAKAPAESILPFLTGHYIFVAADKWFSAYPPSYSLILSIGHWIGSVHSIILLLSILNLVLLFFLLKRNQIDTKTTIFFILLYALSPTYLFHSASYYNHIGELTIVLIILHSYFNIKLHKITFSNLILLGLAVSVGIGIRPMTTCAIALPIAYLTARHLTKKKSWKKTLIPILVFITSTSLYLIYNTKLTGSPWNFPYLLAGSNNQKLTLFVDWIDIERVVRMLAESSNWLLPIGFFDELKYGATNHLLSISFYLFISSFFYYFYKTRKTISPQAHNFIKLLSSIFFCLVLSHIFYRWSGGRFGERFFFELIWVPLLVFIITISNFFKNKKYQTLPICLIFLLLAKSISATYETQLKLANENKIIFKLHKELQSPIYNDSLVILKGRPTNTSDQQFLLRNSPYLDTATLMIAPSLFASNIEDSKEIKIISFIKEQTHKKKVFFYFSNDALLIPFTFL